MSDKENINKLRTAEKQIGLVRLDLDNEPVIDAVLKRAYKKIKSIREILEELEEK